MLWDKAGGASIFKERLKYIDEQIVIVDKPPGMTTMRHAEEAAEFGRRAQRCPDTARADPGQRRRASRSPQRALVGLDLQRSAYPAALRQSQDTWLGCHRRIFVS